MRKSLYLAFIGLLALSMGCAMSNYPIITDNTGDGDMVVNTNGKAYVNQSQVITLWPNQNEELFAMIDQKANGDSTITNYTSVSFGAPQFLDHQYCNPDWTGCSFLTADNAGIFFVYNTNPNCQGYRSWSVTVAYGGRDFECGRSIMSEAGLDAIGDWAQAAVLTPQGYQMVANRGNTSIVGIDPLENRYNASIYGQHSFLYTIDKGVMYRPTPSASPTALGMARMTEEYGVTQWEITYLGHSLLVNAELNTTNLVRNFRGM